MSQEAWGRWGAEDERGALNHIGATGPLAQAAGHDGNYLAMAGVLHRNGVPPRFFDPPIADMTLASPHHAARGLVRGGQALFPALIDGAPPAARPNFTETE